MPRAIRTLQCRQRDQMLASLQPKTKKAKNSSNLDGELAAVENAKIDELSFNLNKVVVEMFVESGRDLHEWIKNLLNEVDDKGDNHIFPKFLAKFPQIKENIGLIQPAYECRARAHPSFIYNLKTKFREIVPAIISMATQLNGLTIAEHQSAEESDYRAGKLLAKLIKDEVTGKSCDYNRLVFEANSSELFSVLKKKIDAKVTAPAILAVGSFPDMSFYIAVDDVPLKVHGTFADALQSYMEVTWLFNLEYDYKVKAYTNFFEMMMGYAKPSTSNGSQLYQKLLKLKDTQKPASTAGVTASMNNID